MLSASMDTGSVARDGALPKEEDSGALLRAQEGGVRAALCKTIAKNM